MVGYHDMTQRLDLQRNVNVWVGMPIFKPHF